jgi:hypothetical protein
VHRDVINAREGHGWVVFLDVFGFGAMLHDHDYAATQDRLIGCRERLLDLPGWRESPPSIHSFSDSTFLFYEVTAAKDKLPILRRCKEDIEQVLGIFAESELPLRGGIAYGSVAFGTGSIVGEAVARAVRYESSLRIPLVLLPAREVIGEDSHGEIGWLPEMTDIELKEGQLIHGGLIFPRPLEVLTRLATQRYESYKIWGPYDVAKAWHQVLVELKAVSQRRTTKDG